MFYPFGDQRLQCTETLSEPELRVLMKTQQLFDHLADGRRGWTRVFVGIPPAVNYVDPWLSSFDERLRQLTAQPRRIAYFYERTRTPAPFAIARSTRV